MQRAWWIIVALVLASAAMAGGCSGPDGPRRSSLVTDSQ
jgi:hypothetical protein